MRQIEDKPFDVTMLHMFPNEPDLALSLEQYARPKIKALPIKKFSQQIIPVIGNKYPHREDAVLYPMTSIRPEMKVYRSVHSLFEQTMRVGLIMSAKDEPLLNFVRHPKWVDVIKNRGFDFVLSPNISFYANQPSCSTVANRFLVYKTVAELVRGGVPVIPSANFLWESDLVRYAKWITDCGFDYVYMNFQTVKHDSDFELALGMLKLLNKHIHCGVVILGVFDVDRIKVIEKVRRCHYVSTQLHIYAAGRFSWKRKEVKKLDVLDGMFYDDVYQDNLVSYRAAVSER